MIHPVISALFSTGVTDICANITYFLVELTSASHHLSGKDTNIGTFIVQLNAPGENLHILFFKTGICTVDALSCTFIAGINTSLKLFVTHDY